MRLWLWFRRLRRCTHPVPHVHCTEAAPSGPIRWECDLCGMAWEAGGG